MNKESKNAIRVITHLNMCRVNKVSLIDIYIYILIYFDIFSLLSPNLLKARGEHETKVMCNHSFQLVQHSKSSFFESMLATQKAGKIGIRNFDFFQLLAGIVLR